VKCGENKIKAKPPVRERGEVAEALSGYWVSEGKQEDECEEDVDALYVSDMISRKQDNSKTHEKQSDGCQY
jgi:hypothetical protein